MEHSTNRLPARTPEEAQAGREPTLDDAAGALTAAFLETSFDDDAAFGALCDRWIDVIFAFARRTEPERSAAEAITARILVSCLARALERRVGRPLEG